MTSARQRKKRLSRKGPSVPRVIGANDNHLLGANDNGAVVVRGVTLTQNQRIRLATAEAKLAEKDLDTRRDGARMMAALEAEIAAAETARISAEGIEERRGLEALRDFSIGASTVEGAVGSPFVGKDGLRNLTRAWKDRATQEMMPPALDPHGNDFAAGLRYRTDYERIDPERKLTPPTLMREGKASSGGGEGYDAKRAESWDRIRTVHLMIAGVSPGLAPTEHTRPNMPNLPANHPAMRAIHALIEVAGKGTMISEMTNSGSVKARIRDDLLFALEACCIVYGLE